MADETKDSTPPETTSLWKGFVSGGFGGMCLVAVGQPLDMLKVRLQATNKYKNAYDCFKTIIREEGPLGLYKGMSAPLSGVTPIFAINFWAYDLGCNTIANYTKSPKEDLTLLQYGVAGAFAAIPTTAVMAPGERIKCILQVQNAAGGVPKYNGPIDVIKGIVREGGVTQLFRGSAATLARDGSGSFFYFSFYEGIKRELSKKSGGELNPLAVVAGGGMAGVANWTVAIPFDTLKSRIQTYPEGTFTGMADCARKLVAEKGPGALFSGLGPAMLRAFPANAACFLGREVCLKFLNFVAPNW